MTHEGHVNTVLAQQFLLEAEDHGRARDKLRDPGNAPCTPRPNLWRHVVQHGHTRAGRALRQSKVEARIVNEHQHAHPSRPEVRVQPAHELPVIGEVTDDLGEPHDCKALRTLDESHASFVHPHATDSGKRDVGSARGDLACDGGSVQFPGGLASDDEYLLLRLRCRSAHGSPVPGSERRAASAMRAMARTASVAESPASAGKPRSMSAMMRRAISSA